MFEHCKYIGVVMPRTFAPNEEPLSQRAYRELRQQILDGQLRPGQRLPLRSVANSLGMSMAPVGEAFRHLSRDGLIEMEPGWGARVRRLGADALRNQHILRTALECEAIRHCTERATETQLAELTQLAEELDRRIDAHAEPKQVYELDSQFHLRIAQSSGVTSLVQVLKANQLVRMLARGSLIAWRLERPPRQHLALVEAIRTRDPDRAERAMREHCVQSMELQLAHLTAADPGE
jgi:DNA-binding GntR family transcriptional regulator